MAKKVTITGRVERVWDIDGYPTYFFADDGQLYRLTSTGDLRRNQRCIKRYTAGYVLKSRFFSLAQLRPMLKRHLPTTEHQSGL
ncbi:MAG: hypothetical protein EOO39_23600 [Cytophagaceae bacterium]|nr:MAG: hypothetical protein EOO39_23600 [Cytophagaceae bacterium]